MSQEFKDLQSFSTKTFSTVQEARVFAIAPGDIDGIADLTGRTPFDSLLSKEERELVSSHLDEEEQAIRIEAIGALLSFLLQPTHTKSFPLPEEVATRVYVLAYSVAPQLVGGMSLENIGKLFSGDPKSRAMMSKRVIKNDELLNLRARNRKSETARAKYSEITTENHRERIEEERRLARLEYSRRYKAMHRGLISLSNKDYYLRNKARILANQRKNRAAKSPR